MDWMHCDECGVAWPITHVIPVLLAKTTMYYSAQHRMYICLRCAKQTYPDQYDKHIKLRDRREEQRDRDLAPPKRP